MMSQRAWNDYEISLLVEYFWKIENKEMNKNDGLIELSSFLRRMAINSNEIIDDTFRNLNGMKLQFMSIEKCFFSNRNSIGNPSKKFKEIADLYLYKNVEYVELLNEAHNKINDDSFINYDNRRKFLEWLDNKLSNNEINEIITALDIANLELKNGKIIDVDLLNFDNKEELKGILISYTKNNIFKFKHRVDIQIINKQLYLILAFCDFVVTDNNGASNNENSINNKNSSSVRLVLSNSCMDYTFTKPVLFSYFGVINTNIDNWKDVYKYFISSIIEDYQISDYLINVVKTITKPNFDTILIKDDLYLDVNLSNNELINIMSQVTNYLSIPDTELIIEYDNVDTIKNDIVNVQLSDIDCKILKIIESKHSNGFIPGPINFKKIRLFFQEMYNNQLDLTNEEIITSLEKSCFKYSNKYYSLNSLISNEILSNVETYIKNSFRSKNYVVYEDIYSAFSCDINPCVSMDMLKNILQLVFKDYYYFETYMSFENLQSIDYKAEIEAVLMDYIYPLSIERIASLLPHISIEKIRGTIGRDKKILIADNKARFLVDSFNISDEELNEIRRYLNSNISANGSVYPRELIDFIRNKMSDFYSNSIKFGDIGIRSVIEYYLCNEYSFKSNVVSFKNSSIDSKQIFLNFANSKKHFSLDSLLELRKEVGSSDVYLDAIFENFTRINSKDFVPDEEISFSIDIVDEIIEHLISGDYMPLKKACNFVIYPAFFYPWNEFLLEMYVAKYSNKFKLIHNVYNKESCVGAIVKKESPINCMNDFIIRYLIDNKNIQDVDSALSSLKEEGYIAFKRYTGIDDLLFKAKSMR